MTPNPQLRIGTSGWNYRDWRGRFYPPGVKHADWLSYFSRHFDTTEVNYSFYRIPPIKVVERWVEQTPAGFRFAIKLWRGITQYRKLKNCRTFLENFFAVFEPLPRSKQGPLLIQLPPSLGRDVERLDSFLGELRQATAPRRWDIAVEFRRDDWLCDEVYKMLDRHRAALCLHDMQGRAAVHAPQTAGFVYVRRHGTTAKYAGSYSDEQIAEDACRIRQWQKAGKSVYVYFNNDLQGHAIENGRALRRLLGLETKGIS